MTLWHSAGMTQASEVIVEVPGPLRAYVAGASQLSLSVASVRAALERLEREHPLLYRNICDETGKVRRHLNIFVNSDNVRDLEGLDTALAAGDTLIILPAVSGI